MVVLQHSYNTPIISISYHIISAIKLASFPPPRNSTVEVPLLSKFESDYSSSSPPPSRPSSPSSQTGSSPSMPSRGPFGLSGRRLHVGLLSFFIISMLLWSQRPSSSSSTTSEDNLKINQSTTGDYKEGLAEWEAPVKLEGEDGQLLPESELSHSSCQPTRPRDSPGHITAFLIMVHSPETLEGARQLIEQIYDPHDYFLIHADKKLNKTLYEQYKPSLSICGNVHFVPDEERVNIGWGDIVSYSLSLSLAPSFTRLIRSKCLW